MLFLHQHVIVDIANGKRALLPDEGEDLAQFLPFYRAEPAARRRPVSLHGADEEPDVPGQHVGQRVRPVFENRLVHALSLAQMLASIFGNARIEDVVVAAFDHVDGVDLHIAKMLDGGGRRLRPVAERRARFEPLRAQPDASCLGLGEGVGFARHGGSLGGSVAGYP
jgi:hypothetical protein